MSDNRPIGNLSTYDARDWVVGESLTKSKLQGEFNQIAGLIGEIKQALADIQSRRSNSGHSATENAIEGQIVHDSDSGLWYGDPDGSGADDQIATELSAYQGDYATAGTDTFKFGGTLDVDTASGEAYQVPANTLNANDDYITLVAAGSADSLAMTFGSITPKLKCTGAGTVFVKSYVVRTAAGAQKSVSVIRGNIDSSGSTALVSVDAGTVDETAAAQMVAGDSWTQIGSDLNISGIGIPALAALSSTRVAFIDNTLDELRAYDWDGSNWTLTGTGLSIATSSVALCALSSNRVAAFVAGQLRAYDFSGSTWSQVGNGLTISGAASVALATLSSARVAYYDSGNNDLRTYDFDGTDWSQVGNDLNIATSSIGALCGLSSSRVAFIDSTNADLRTYDFDGTDWSQTGNDLNIAATNSPALATLSARRVAFIDNGNEDLRTYDFDGTDWVQIGTELNIVMGATAIGLAALDSTHIAFIDAVQEDLRTYALAAPSSQIIGFRH